MRIHVPASSNISLSLRSSIALSGLVVCAACLLFSATLSATSQPLVTTSAASQPTVHKTAQAHKRTSKNVAPAQPVQTKPVPVAPPAPKPPDWPVNDQPANASVVWNSQGLRIEASNSSLRQILNDVSTATGTKMEGLATDQRIFGSYGPGSARDVLAKLLEGSGYNVLMIGDLGQGTPRQLLLTARSSGSAPQNLNNNAQSQPSDENADADDQPQQPQPPPSIRNGFAPGAPPRTPQQIMQEMQQRQMQQNGVAPQ